MLFTHTYTIKIIQLTQYESDLDIIIHGISSDKSLVRVYYFSERLFNELYDLFFFVMLSISGVAWKMGHSSKTAWLFRKIFCREFITNTDSDNNSQVFTTQPPTERKIHIKHSIFRGDPREFLG